MIKIAIVEDSEGDAKTLSDYCRRYADEKGKQFDLELFDNGFDFVTSNNLDYDIIMLDIKMPYMNGMQTAQKIREANENVCIIFVTNMQQYAIHGYDVNATDFIVRPVKYNMFSFTFDRVMSILKRNRGQTIVIKTNRMLKYMKLSDILYIESQQHKLIYHTVEGDFEAWGPLKEVREIIKSRDFALCNSGCFVNLRYVEEVDNSSVTIMGTKLVISRLKRKSFLDALTSYGCSASVINADRITGDRMDGGSKRDT